MTKRHAIECRLLRNTADAIELMKSLRAIDRSSLDSDLPRAALALLQANTEAIREFLRDHPIDVAQVWSIVLDRAISPEYLTVRPLSMWPGFPSGLSIKAVHVDTAVPDLVPGDGSVARITFRGHAEVEVSVKRQNRMGARLYDRPYGATFYSPFLTYHLPGMPAIELVDIPIAGRVRASFRALAGSSCR